MPAATKVRLAMTVNGEPAEVLADAAKTLLEVLREDLQLTGTKHGCELGECGACAVLLDGTPVLSCLVLGVECDGREVTTVEGLATGGHLHPLQDAFADHGAAQCGYCTPGILVTAKALLDAEPHPSRERIKDALSGNLCRCTGYLQIFEAIESAARSQMEAGPSGPARPAGLKTRPPSDREGAAPGQMEAGSSDPARPAGPKTRPPSDREGAAPGQMEAGSSDPAAR